MATKSAEKRVMEQALLRLGPAQLSMLPGSPATIEYTGKPGRPKNRKNNRTLMSEAGLEQMGEALVRERVRLGLCDPLAEAMKRVRLLHGLADETDPRVHYREEVAKWAEHFDHLKAKEANNGLPFVRKKMPQEVDVTERHFVLIKQVGMDDDGLGDAAASAKNVTPPKPEEDL